MATLHIRIDTLALAGLDEAGAARALRSFEAELEAALARGALPELRPRTLERLRVGPLPTAARTPEATGRALAQALLAELAA